MLCLHVLLLFIMQNCHAIGNGTSLFLQLRDKSLEVQFKTLGTHYVYYCKNDLMTPFQMYHVNDQ